MVAYKYVKIFMYNGIKYDEKEILSKTKKIHFGPMEPVCIV